MKTSAPVHVDRLAQAMKAAGIDLKRSRLIEIAAAAFGYHNSNEFQAAARRGDLTPPLAEISGSLTTDDGTTLVVLQATDGLPYAIVRSALGTDRATTVGVSPYGGMVTMPAVENDATIGRAAASPPTSGGTAYVAIVERDVDPMLGVGQIHLVTGRTSEECETALAAFCRNRWHDAHDREGFVTGHLPLEYDGLDDAEVIETYFLATLDCLVDRRVVCVGDAEPRASVAGLPNGMVAIDADLLGTLVEAADGHAETLKEDVDDDGLSSEHRESTGRFIDDIENALRTARRIPAPASDRTATPLVEGDDFRVVHRTVLDLLVSAAESHSEDATTGVDDGIYDKEDNEWIDDLDGAIAAAKVARAPLDATSQPHAERKEILYAIIRTRDYDEVVVGMDEATLNRQIASRCRQAWTLISGTPHGELDPDLLPDDQVVEMFYGVHEGGDTCEQSLTRGAAPLPADATHKALGMATTHDQADAAPRLLFGAGELAEALRAGVEADVWTDAAERGEEEAVIDVVETKDVMRRAADMLTALSASPPPAATIPRAMRDRRETIVWTTDVEGDVIYDITREELENLGLPYIRGDDGGEWMPLTDDEFACLRPGRHDMSSTWDRTHVDIPGLEDGRSIRLGQSCVWMGEKWLVPVVEFAFGEGEKDDAFRRAEAYVRDIKPLLDVIGGHVKVYANATDCAHCIDVFVPMRLALQFEGSEDLYQALRWLTCPSDLRDGIVRVMATFGTPDSGPGYTVEWDATFDVLLEGRAWAESCLRGDRDEDLTMRLAESGLAHKDAWSLWNENWDLELDTDALRRLHSIR